MRFENAEDFLLYFCLKEKKKDKVFFFTWELYTER